MKAKDFSKASVESLVLAQQQMEHANNNMHALFEQVLKDFSEKKVRKEYRDSLEEKLRGKIIKNNNLINSIDEELFKRVKNLCGMDVTTISVMSGLISEYEAEKKAQQLHLNKEEIKSKIINLGKEKKD